MQQPVQNKIFLGLFVLLTVVLMLNAAWVAEDSFITFRTIENFHNGYGLRWNIDERVQSYTHPIWMLQLLIGKYIISNLYYLSVFLGFLYTFLTFYFLYKLTKDDFKLFFLLACALLASQAFLDYSTSGLENSFSHFLIGLFFYLLPKRNYLLLSLTLSCMFLNRMDLIIPFLPIAVYLFFVEPYKNKEFKVAIFKGSIGFVPVILWSFFAIYYYGSFFPNSVWAKINTGLPSASLYFQGFIYFIENFKNDPFTLMVIFISMFLLIFSKKSIPVLLGLGLVFYSFYLIKVGGDYMFGRFLTIPFVFSIFSLTLMNFKFSLIKEQFAMVLLIIFISANMVFYCLLSPSKSGINNDTGMADERAFYYSSTGFIPVLSGTNKPFDQVFGHSIDVSDDMKVLDLKAVGIDAYILAKENPDIYILDLLALGDSFLAQHPIMYGYWRAGHYERGIPSEYMLSLQQKKNMFTNPDEHFVLEQMWLLSRASLNDPRRIDAIVNLHTGKIKRAAANVFQYYDHAFYLEKNKNEPRIGRLWLGNLQQAHNVPK